MKKKKKIIGILVLFICIILICMFYSMRYIFLQEDLIFFQMFHSIIKSEKNSNNQKEYKEILAKMDELKAKGRVKSATYQQLMGRKLMYQNMLSLYELYGLIDGN